MFGAPPAFDLADTDIRSSAVAAARGTLAITAAAGLQTQVLIVVIYGRRRVHELHGAWGKFLRVENQYDGIDPPSAHPPRSVNGAPRR